MNVRRVVAVVVGALLVLATTACTSSPASTAAASGDYAFDGIKPPVEDPLAAYSQKNGPCRP